MKIISVVGRTNSGKTTLIERLIPLLAARGARVATIKHDAHRFEMDHPGKDTYRHFAAGARISLIASADKVALQRRIDAPMTIDQLAARYIDDVDLIVTEGYKSADKPKIEVWRPELGPPLCGPGDGVIAVVAAGPVELPGPRFGWDELERLADFIVEKFVD